MGVTGGVDRRLPSSRAKRGIVSAGVRGLLRRSLTAFGMTAGSAKGPRLLWALFSCAAAIPVHAQTDEHQWRAARERLVAEHLVPQGISDPATVAAMRAVPRHEFVPPGQRPYAYDDTPLPIGHDQTISQPTVVAFMTQLVRPRPGMRVLEVGTGSGYQAAVLAETGARVWTIEIFRVLAETAQARLARLGYRGVTVRHGDGYEGWPEESPFDAIVVTAGADSIPAALIEQLAPGGRLVMPVGDPLLDQELVLVEKDAVGRVASSRILPVRFVPLLRGVR
jgi:protein-L-isoaspartate(D-aspartate) O-methyltransferase